VRILAIDPGVRQSGWVEYRSDNHTLEGYGIKENQKLAHRLIAYRDGYDKLVIEMIACYGMAVGKDVFETCVWIGRFEGAWGTLDRDRVLRREVKLHLCNNVRAKDTHVRQALIDKFGGREKAIGGIKCERCKGKGWAGRGRPTCAECAGSGWQAPPGPLAGVISHVWAALAVAVTYAEKEGKR